jgi:hypothetical protein
MSYTAQDRHPSADAERQAELLSPATQVVGDTDAYLGNPLSDVGRRIADDQVELFVSCAPAEAMAQQFARLKPDFIALHDVGAAASTRLLAAVAKAASSKLQQLAIRRQGYGVALATLQFVELPTPGGRKLRVYSTQIDGDTQTRHQLALVLLAHSRLAAIMVGDLPAHALESNLQPLREAIAAGPWPNRQILMVSLGAAPTLPSLATAMAGHSGVQVRTTPQVARPVDAWSYISSAWNRLNSSTADVRPAPAARPASTASVAPAAPNASARPRDSRPMPLVTAPRADAAPSVPAQSPWADYLRRCAAIKGVTEACVLDLDLQRSLAHAGNQRTADRLAAKGAMLHAMIIDSAHALGLTASNPDAAITLDQHYLLLHPVPGRPRAMLHMLIDRHQGNIGLARAQLHQIDQALAGQA